MFKKICAVACLAVLLPLSAHATSCKFLDANKNVEFFFDASPGSGGIQFSVNALYGKITLPVSEDNFVVITQGDREFSITRAPTWVGPSKALLTGNSLNSLSLDVDGKKDLTLSSIPRWFNGAVPFSIAINYLDGGRYKPTKYECRG